MKSVPAACMDRRSEWTKQLLDRVDSDILLVEADDAMGLPFKAPLAGEPRIPAETSLVVSVVVVERAGNSLGCGPCLQSSGR